MDKRISAAIAGAFVGAALVAVPVVAQDKAKPSAKAAATAAKDQRGRKVLVENDRVLVTETSYKPGASSGMLERGARVTRALTAGTLEKTWADGKKETIDWKVGQVRYNPKETFDQKNVGKAEVVLYTVTLK